MDRRKLAVIFVFLSAVFVRFAAAGTVSGDLAEAGQQVGDFSLSGFGEKGKKSWDLSGKSADIFDEVVKLKKVIGNNYTGKDAINLTADKGDFDKKSGVVHLEDNVVITTASGAKLTTDTLDWDRKQQIISTLDKVNLQRQDMNLSGQGAQGATALKQIVLKKDVRLDIQAQDKSLSKKEKIVITCDGPLDVDYEKNIAIFNNNVKVEKPDMIIYSDKMRVYFDTSAKPKPALSGQDKAQGSVSTLSKPQFLDQGGRRVEAGGKKPAAAPAKGVPAIGNSIDKIVASGNVRIVRGENISYSQEAVYTAGDKKLTLNGRPQIVIYQTEKIDETFGN
ncbi:MAG: LPS export ABC transporter periplasmic protein LptC [Candidatus Omnitrophica bacterium]|jgi:LPS export ABC transporter protein LptC|nr:LPS export ABC transporter periplasmic protein LptC [Candidatus Omnitrophota bacterium]